MKKLLLLSALLIFACSSDDSTSDDNDNQQENVIRIGNQEYPIEKGVIKNSGTISQDDIEWNEYLENCVGYYEMYLVFGESSMPNNIFTSGHVYTGYYIDIGFLSENLDGQGNYSGSITMGNCNFVQSDYDLTYNEQGGGTNDESWVFSDGGSLSVEKSGNTYTVEYTSIDDDGNNIEVYYNGQISYWD